MSEKSKKFCYSHLKDIKIKISKGKASLEEEDEYNRKLREMKDRFGEELQTILDGNDEAEQAGRLGKN